MLVAIDEAGSFTAAAKRVDRAQSAVSHAIRTLEADIGVALFDRSTRKPQLTAEGNAVLEEARAILSRMGHLKARARGMASGMEAELSLAVSVLAPQSSVADLLARFAAAFPTCGLRLFVEEIGAATNLIMDGRADLALIGRPSLSAGLQEQFETRAVGAVDIVHLACPDHPLARKSGQLREVDLQDYRQLVPTSRALPRYHNRLVNDVWEVAEPGMRRALLLQGLAWGTLPLHIVEQDLEQGDLVLLDIPARPKETMRVPLFAVHKREFAPGPAARWLMDEMPGMFPARLSS